MQQEKREGEAVTIYLSGVEWRAFRLACVRRRTSASKEISRFIREQLAAWTLADVRNVGESLPSAVRE